MVKCFNAKMCGLALLLFLCGCAIEYHSDTRAVGTTIQELESQLKLADSNVDGLTEELKEAKISRDAIAKAAETASVWDSPMLKLEQANQKVEWAAKRLTWAKEWRSRVEFQYNSKTNTKSLGEYDE